MPPMDQTLAFAKQPGPAPNSPVSCSYSQLKLLKTLNSPGSATQYSLSSLLPDTISSCEECVPQGNPPAYARPGKASQGPRKNSSASLASQTASWRLCAFAF